jgi:hypothetical protein
MESNMEAPQKNKNRIAVWFSNTTPRNIPKGMSIYNKDTCIPMFIAALFTKVKVWKQPRCPTTDEWINEM